MKIGNSNFVVQKELRENIFNLQSTFNIVVVKDNVYDSIKRNNKVHKIRVIDMVKEDTLELSSQIEKIVDDNIEFKYPFNVTSKIKIYTSVM